MMLRMYEYEYCRNHFVRVQYGSVSVGNGIVLIVPITLRIQLSFSPYTLPKGSDSLRSYSSLLEGDQAPVHQIMGKNAKPGTSRPDSYVHGIGFCKLASTGFCKHASTGYCKLER